MIIVMLPSHDQLCTRNGMPVCLSFVCELAHHLCLQVMSQPLCHIMLLPCLVFMAVGSSIIRVLVSCMLPLLSTFGSTLLAFFLTSDLSPTVFCNFWKVLDGCVFWP